MNTIEGFRDEHVLLHTLIRRIATNRHVSATYGHRSLLQHLITTMQKYLFSIQKSFFHTNLFYQPNAILQYLCTLTMHITIDLEIILNVRGPGIERKRVFIGTVLL